MPAPMTRTWMDMEVVSATNLRNSVNGPINYAIGRELGSDAASEIEDSLAILSGSGNRYFLPPGGTLGQRPATPEVGMMRWNTTNEAMDIYTGNAWEHLQTHTHAFEVDRVNHSIPSQASAPNYVQLLTNTTSPTERSFVIIIAWNAPIRLLVGGSVQTPGDEERAVSTPLSNPSIYTYLIPGNTSYEIQYRSGSNARIRTVSITAEASP